MHPFRLYIAVVVAASLLAAPVRAQSVMKSDSRAENRAEPPARIGTPARLESIGAPKEIPRAPARYFLTEKLVRKLDGPVAGLAFGKDALGEFVVSVTTLGTVSRFDSDGHPLWQSRLGEAVAVAPLVTRDGRIVVGCESGRVHFLGARGETLARFRARGAVSAPPVEGPTGTILIGTSDGSVEALSGVPEFLAAYKAKSAVSSRLFQFTDSTIVGGTVGGELYFLLDRDAGAAGARRHVLRGGGGNATPPNPANGAHGIK